MDRTRALPGRIRIVKRQFLRQGGYLAFELRELSLNRELVDEQQRDDAEEDEVGRRLDAEHAGEEVGDARTATLSRQMLKKSQNSESAVLNWAFLILRVTKSSTRKAETTREMRRTGFMCYLLNQSENRMAEQVFAM